MLRNYLMQATTKNHLITLAVLAGLNILLGNLVVGDGQDLTGRGIPAHSPEMRKATITTFLVGIQLISGLIALLVAVVPFQKKSYQQRVEATILPIAIGLQALFLVASLVKLFLKFMGS